MVKLILSDLVDHISTWIGAFAIALTCGYIGGWVASLEATANTSRGVQNAGSAVMIFSLIAAIVVLTSAANLTVSSQRRSYALWQLANVKPSLVKRVVLAQLGCVAVVGALVGTIMAAFTFAPIFPLLFEGITSEAAQMTPIVDMKLMPVVWLSVLVTFLCGGMKAARSAANTPPLIALREPEAKHAGMTWLRTVLFAGLLVAVCWVVSHMVGESLNDVMNWSLYLPILTTALLASVAPLAFSALMRTWTALIPQAHGRVWYLARHSARYSLSSSTSVEVPIMVGFGIVAGLYSILNLWAGYTISQGDTTFTGLSWNAAVLMLAGPVLLCTVGAATSVVMTSRTRTRDSALLIASGAQPKTLIASAVCEALIHATTATLMGVFAVVVSNALVAYSIGLPLMSGLAFGEGLLVSIVGFVLVLSATLIPTVATAFGFPGHVHSVSPLLAMRS